MSRPAQSVHRLGGHEQSQGRIQAAGYANGHRHIPHVRQPASQAGHLRVENLLAALAQLLLAARHKGMRVYLAIKRQRSPLAVQRERYSHENAWRRGRFRSREAIGPLSLHAQTFQIKVSDEKVLLALEALRFLQDRAVLRDQAMSAEG